MSNFRHALEDAAGVIKRQLIFLRASTESELASAFADAVKQGARALLVTQDALFNDRREQLVALAAQYKLPVIYPQREFAEKGGLASDTDVSDQFRQAWLGALLVFVGVLQMAFQPIWRGRLSATKRLRY